MKSSMPSGLLIDALDAARAPTRRLVRKLDANAAEETTRENQFRRLYRRDFGNVRLPASGCHDN